MSEEEKKSIEFLKKHIIPYYEYKGKIKFMINDVILNLIEKQQKEIKELKEDLSKKVEALDTAMNNPDYISKDKIKEEIKKLNKNNGVAVNMHTGQIVKTEEDYKIAILRKLLRSK